MGAAGLDRVAPLVDLEAQEWHRPVLVRQQECSAKA
jgi:hypothetical protein